MPEIPDTDTDAIQVWTFETDTTETTLKKGPPKAFSITESSTEMFSFVCALVLRNVLHMFVQLYTTAELNH